MKIGLIQMNEQERAIQKKAEYFFNNKIAVHIVKKNKFFHNGFILELQGDLIILNDEVDGTMHIYSFEVLEIEKRREKNE